MTGGIGRLDCDSRFCDFHPANSPEWLRWARQLWRDERATVEDILHAMKHAYAQGFRDGVVYTEGRK